MLEYSSNERVFVMTRKVVVSCVIGIYFAVDIVYEVVLVSMMAHALWTEIKQRWGQRRKAK